MIHVILTIYQCNRSTFLCCSLHFSFQNQLQLHYYTGYNILKLKKQVFLKFFQVNIETQMNSWFETVKQYFFHTGIKLWINDVQVLYF